MSLCVRLFVRLFVCLLWMRISMLNSGKKVMAHVLFVIVFSKNVNRVTVPQFQVSPHVESMMIIFPRKDTRPRCALSCTNATPKSNAPARCNLCLLISISG